ncbi:hypothetical protein VIN01S_24470 [Vibrio inusitatus NBRC 102082]|uniref:Transposase n=1 Tax=Vibrio inusitatus NBRC 102082 TaxID=1219070 RepID=A0A4Y3HWK8_9VIBR|nr:hypothetical protein [Vibrio inusitatus]GEA51408.1 hypothetical protein VIN01S_22120 [Vibrio inusitatus NBRC 102082]GEA51643.1 hypothetical protein VIN01S_24470 [Vibrio inusitatus NBRC 102082]
MAKKLTLDELYKVRRRGKLEFGDAKEELIEVRKAKTIRHKTLVHISKLDKYAFQLRSLIKVGASVTELHFWLQAQGVECARSTVYRWRKKHEKKDEEQ